MVRADRDFEAILLQVKAKNGPKSLQAADLISAFGVELFNQDIRGRRPPV